MHKRRRHLLLLVTVLLVGHRAIADELAFLDSHPDVKAQLASWENEAPAEVRQAIEDLRSISPPKRHRAAMWVADLGSEGKGSILALFEAATQPTSTFERHLSPAERIPVKVEDALVSIGEPSIDALLAAFDSRLLRALAARALGRIGDLAVLDPLLQAMESEHWDQRFEATRAVERLIEQHTANALLEILEKGAEEVRPKAASELGSYPEQPVVEPLITALADDSVEVRKHAAQSLGGLGNRKAVEPLTAALRDSRIAESALQALRQIGDPKAVEPVLGVLRARSDLKWKALRALDAIDPEWRSHEAAKKIVGPLLEDLQSDFSGDRERAAWILGELGDPRAVEPLAAALADRAPLVRAFAATALGQIGDSRAIGPLIEALGDPQSRDEAAKALEHITGQNLGAAPEAWRRWHLGGDSSSGG